MESTSPPRPAPTRALAWLAVAVCLACVLAVAFSIAQRLPYPYQLEWLEGAVLQQTHEVLEGRSPYAEPSPRFSPFYYTPLYYYASALAIWIAGDGLLGPRLVSLAASVGCLWLIFALVRRETDDPLAALCAASLYAASYWWVGRWFEVARVDALCLCLALAGAFTLRFAAGLRSAALAGALLCLATCTKQSAAVLAAPLLAWALLRDPRRALAAGAAAALLGAAAFAFLEWQSGGWFSFCLGLPANHPFRAGGLRDFFATDLLGNLPFALAGIGLALASAGRPLDGRFHAALVLGGLLAALLPRIKEGGSDNNLMPLFATLAVAFGAALARLRSAPGPSTWRGSAALGLAIAQLLWLAPWRGVSRWIPTSEDRAAGDGILELLRATEREVLVPTATHLARWAGKRSSAHHMNITDLYLWNREAPELERLGVGFRRALRAGAYDLVLLDNGRGHWYVPLPAPYRYCGRLFPEGVFEPTSGTARYVPAHLYLRRGATAEGWPAVARDCARPGTW